MCQGEENQACIKVDVTALPDDQDADLSANSTTATNRLAKALRTFESFTRRTTLLTDGVADECGNTQKRFWFRLSGLDVVGAARLQTRKIPC